MYFASYLLHSAIPVLSYPLSAYSQDSFYRRFKGSPFPEAIEANGSELAAVTQKVTPDIQIRQPLL